MQSLFRALLLCSNHQSEPFLLQARLLRSTFCARPTVGVFETSQASERVGSRDQDNSQFRFRILKQGCTVYTPWDSSTLRTFWAGPVKKTSCMTETTTALLRSCTMHNVAHGHRNLFFTIHIAHGPVGSRASAYASKVSSWLLHLTRSQLQQNATEQLFCINSVFY